MAVQNTQYSIYKKLNKVLKFKTLKYYDPERSVIKIKNIGNRKNILDYTNLKQFLLLLLRGLRLYYSPIGRRGYTTDLAFGLVSRLLLYRDFDLMDADIVSSSLDILADLACIKDYSGLILKILSLSEIVKKILLHLFYVQLSIDYNLWDWVRNTVKYGDFFLRLIMAKGKGIIDYLFLNPKDVAVFYDQLNDMKYYIVNLLYEGTTSRVVQNSFNFLFEIQKIKDNPDYIKLCDYIFTDTLIIHFSLLNKSKNFKTHDVYGRSYLDAARRVWKQLLLTELAAIIHRLVRSPEKRIYYINVGNLDRDLALLYVEKFKNKVKKVRLLDLNGDYNLNYNYLNVLLDMFVPIRGNDDSGTRILRLLGLTWNATLDILYFRNKLIATLKIPRAFLTYDETINAKATLSSQSVRFAKTIGRIQLVMILGLKKIAINHLYLQGFDIKEIILFDIHLTNPSIIDEEEKLLMTNSRINTARDMLDLKMFDYNHIYLTVFNMSEDLSDDMKLRVKKSMELVFELNKILSLGKLLLPLPEKLEPEPELPEKLEPLKLEPLKLEPLKLEPVLELGLLHNKNMKLLGMLDDLDSDNFEGGHPDSLDGDKSRP